MRKEYPLDFVRFYQAYPKCRHAGYVLPYRSWVALEKKHELPSIEVLIKSIEAQKKTRQWIDGFVPMMSTWLNQQRWEANIVDNDVKDEHEFNVKNQEQSEYVQQQQTLNREVLALKQVERDRLVYNINKFIRCADTKLVGDIANYFGDIIAYNDVTFYVNTESSVFQVPAIIYDVLVDVCGLKSKSNDLSTLNYIFDNYRATLLLTLFVRYCDGVSFEIMPKLLTFSTLELANLRKLLHTLCTPDKCNGFRVKYGLKPYYTPDTWLLAVSPDIALKPFAEVL
jgi:hypothetical protein